MTADDLPKPWRVGQKNPYTVYIDSGGPYDEVDAQANSIAYFRVPEDAQRAVDAVNSVREYLRLQGEWLAAVEQDKMPGDDPADEETRE